MKHIYRVLGILLLSGVLFSCASTSGEYYHPYAGVWGTTDSSDISIRMELGVNGKAVVGAYNNTTKKYQSQANIRYTYDGIANTMVFTDVEDLVKPVFKNMPVNGTFQVNEEGTDILLVIEDGESTHTFEFLKKFRKDMTEEERVVDTLLSNGEFDMENSYVMVTSSPRVFGVHAMSNYVQVVTADDVQYLIRDLSPRGSLYTYGQYSFWFKRDGSVEYTVGERKYKGEIIPLAEYLEEAEDRLNFKNR